MTTYLFWKGFLVLALGQPASLKTNGAVLWVSSKESIKVQAQVGQATLLPVRKDFVFLSGFQMGKTEPIPTLITSSANMHALQKCPHNQNIKIIDKKLTFDSNDLSLFPLECGFDDIHFSKENSQGFREKNAKHFLFIEKNLSKSGLKTGTSKWRNQKREISINSSLSEEEVKQKIPFPYRNFYNVLARQSSTPGKNIIFEVTLFEFSRQKARRLGLKIPQTISIYSLNNSGSSSLNLQDLTTGTGKEIFLQADFGESQGVGKVLAQPTLRTQPGIESRFLSGGEFPVKSGNAFHSQTAWKSYGLKVSLTPSKETEIGDTEVALDFNLEFSEPNMEHAVDGTPSIFQRRLESRFDLRMDETTILTSMITLREGKARSGVAFLSQVPILGLLAGQDSKLRNDSELWFAIKPSWEEIPMKSSNRKVALEL